jgi:hypothetical protein
MLSLKSGHWWPIVRQNILIIHFVPRGSQAIGPLACLAHSYMVYYRKLVLFMNTAEILLT